MPKIAITITSGRSSAEGGDDEPGGKTGEETRGLKRDRGEGLEKFEGEGERREGIWANLGKVRTDRGCDGIGSEEVKTVDFRKLCLLHRRSFYDRRPIFSILLLESLEN